MRTGPSPPRNISVRVTSSPEVRITWSPPALPRGVIALYRVYAEPVNTPTDIRDAIDLPVSVSKVHVHSTVLVIMLALVEHVVLPSSKTHLVL